jgi:hypothetical protein
LEVIPAVSFGLQSDLLGLLSAESGFLFFAEAMFGFDTSDFAGFFFIKLNREFLHRTC